MNIWIIDEKTARLRIFTRFGKSVSAIVDTADVETLSRFTWSIWEARRGGSRLRGRARGTRRIGCTPAGGRAPMVAIANVVMRPASGLVVDHINGDSLDNRRENLRVLTPTQNHQNIDRSHQSKTGLPRGVVRMKSGRFRVMHMLRRKQVSLGLFDTIDEAIAAAVAWRAIHMPFVNESRHRMIVDASR